MVRKKEMDVVQKKVQIYLILYLIVLMSLGYADILVVVHFMSDIVKNIYNY